jgi:hypothetical protein
LIDSLDSPKDVPKNCLSSVGKRARHRFHERKLYGSLSRRWLRKLHHRQG